SHMGMNSCPCRMQDAKTLPGAGEGNRTLIISLEGSCSTIELHPRSPFHPQTPAYDCVAVRDLGAGGRSWIRPNVGARPTDLQSAPFNHLGIPPKANIELCRVFIRMSSKSAIVARFLFRAPKPRARILPENCRARASRSQRSLGVEQPCQTLALEQG